MSTLAKLEKSGKLVRYEPELRDEEQPCRQIWLTKECATWITRVAPNVRDRGRVLPHEQVKMRFDDFCRGRPVHDGGDVRHLDRAGRGIYELKTTDVRVFGGFVSKGIFVGALARTKKASARTGYPTFIRDARRALKQLEIDITFGEHAKELDDVL